ncbi:MAG: hypothetical protein LBU18_06420 [Treponema sp.]|nr:hypothetical protein [Treponema sp.]
MEFYQRLYSIASTAKEKQQIFQDAANAKMPDATDFYTWVLERLLLEYPNARGNQDIEAANRIIKSAADLLGEAKHLPSAGYLWRAGNIVIDPTAKAEILVALGKMQAVDFLPQVIQTLNDINEGGVTKNRRDRERIAFGAIVSLENYGDIRGYLPVYIASIGWYSEMVKRQAKESLLKISEDPIEPLTQLVQSPSYSYNAKYEALNEINKSSVSNEAKSNFAIISYKEAWGASTANFLQQMDLAKTRKLCISMINQYKSGDEQVYSLLARSYTTEGNDETEKMGAVNALASLANEDSVRILSGFLAAINDKLRDGSLRQRDERMIRALISALGKTVRPEAASALRSVLGLDWPAAVKRLAEGELQKVQ